ncbi:hypothetical protein NQ318_015237 [Aromia moschata]|uniref:N-acetyltransferase domain-containing protein n=1 Tax=Aromia moschata TaxID=1265417 RepID=A0AAV8YHD3_9CUCU|nr:hypothetical protein NQ318_015237 [Aromia moschata]
MSKRLRLEEEKAKQLLLEQDEVDKLQILHEKIFGPLVWRRLQSGMRIQDLNSEYYEEVLDLIEASYTFLINKVVISGNEEVVAGVLLLKTIKRSNFGRVFSRSMVTDGKSYQSIMEFMNYISRKVDIFDTFECDSYLRYYLICIRPEYRRKGLGYQLMNVGLDIARHLHLPIAMGIFDCYKLQKLAKRLGFEGNNKVLENCCFVIREQETILALPWLGSSAPLPEPEPPPPKPEEEEEVKKKKTRDEKRKEKGKKKKK